MNINIDNIAKLQNSISKMKGEQGLLKKQLSLLKEERKITINKLELMEKSKSIAQHIAQQTQKKIEYHINNLVTTGLKSIFPEPYTFKLSFVTRRNKTEADLIFTKNGNETDNILGSGGGGVADVASYLLSTAIYSINPSRPIFIRDETFKFLHSPSFQEKTSMLIKKMSEEFGIQMILISDQKQLSVCSDNIINVAIKNGKSFTVKQN